MKKKTTYTALLPVIIEIDNTVRGAKVAGAIKQLAETSFSRWSGAGWSYSKKKCRMKDIQHFVSRETKFPK
jgi:hypothetical protein